MDLHRLLGRVLAAATYFPEDFRTRHGGYVLASEREQGGFAGRAGRTDPYYTAFGLASLVLLDRWSEPILQRALDVLRLSVSPSEPQNSPGSMPPWRSWTLAEVVGLVACGLMAQTSAGASGRMEQDPFARWGLSVRQIVQEYLSLVHRPDGGYAKHPASAPSSTYATFLAGLVQQWVGLPLEEPEKTAQMLLGRQRDDGGFAEWPTIRQSGVNPTAAAVGWWSLTGRMPAGVRDRAAAFLAGMQSTEGGFRAHGRLPIADLLSTFTALVALELLEATYVVAAETVRRYIVALELPTGGFRAGLWDDAADVEYTFYGLASLALLTNTTRG